MDILRFTLSGRQAFFKKPDVNAYCYFTYGQIHKVALTGLFGAVLGYGGYSAMAMKDKKNKGDYPEFYERLKDIRISILPVCRKGSFDKKIVEFNNSVGYASQEQGGNLIVKQQWLEEPKWQIYLAVDSEESQRIADALLNKRCVYLPYLGSNDHPADISDVCMISGQQEHHPAYISSMFIKQYVEMDMQDEDDEWFKYEEMLPIGLDKELNMYVYEKMAFSDMKVLNCNSDSVFKLQDNHSETEEQNLNIMLF